MTLLTCACFGSTTESRLCKIVRTRILLTLSLQVCELPQVQFIHKQTSPTQICLKSAWRGIPFSTNRNGCGAGFVIEPVIVITREDVEEEGSCNTIALLLLFVASLSMPTGMATVNANASGTGKGGVDGVSIDGLDLV